MSGREGRGHWRKEENNNYLKRKLNETNQIVFRQFIMGKNDLVPFPTAQKENPPHLNY